MEITALRLLTAHLDAQRAFYTGTLGLPLVAQAADRFTVRAGATRLTFAASDTDAQYPFAFNIPRNTLPQAKAFLAARVPLLSKADQDQFHSDDWNADMVYFADAAGNIAEYIARQTLPDDAPGDFTPATVRGVSEIGLPVDDIPATVAAITARLGVAPYGDQEEQFAPSGTSAGYSSSCARGDIGTQPRQAPSLRPSPSRCTGRGKTPTTCRASRTTST
ncbi:MAG: VOC family protein [Thermomicrobiales bacterium]